MREIKKINGIVHAYILYLKAFPIKFDFLLICIHFGCFHVNERKFNSITENSAKRHF